MALRADGEHMSYTSRIPKITAELAARVDAAVAAGAELVENRAKDRVPVLTGRLRDAIHTERRGVAEVEVVAGGRDVFYGHIIEHGGAHTPARPFMVPAAEESRDEVSELIAAVLRKL